MNWKAFWNESPQVADADFHRQVGRTFQQQPYSPVQMDHLVNRLLQYLDGTSDQRLLDVACGNGLLTSRLSSHYAAVVALDFSRPLIDVARTHFARANIVYMVGDATDLSAIRGPFDRALISAAFQHFDQTQARQVLTQLRALIADDGRLVVGDIADADRRNLFYRGMRGRWRDWADTIRRRPIIGEWWSPQSFATLASREGWSVDVRYQDAHSPNHYFRYDAILIPR